MQAYYVESCHLNVAATDSVQRFMQKVDTFVTHHSDAKQDPLYPRIQENIRSASFRLNINVDDEWDGEYNMTFWPIIPATMLMTTMTEPIVIGSKRYSRSALRVKAVCCYVNHNL